MTAKEPKTLVFSVGSNYDLDPHDGLLQLDPPKALLLDEFAKALGLLEKKKE